MSLEPYRSYHVKTGLFTLKKNYVKTYLESLLKPGFLCPCKMLGLTKKSLLSVGLFFKRVLCV